MNKTDFKTYLSRTLNNLPVNEKYEMLCEIQIATNEAKAELHSICVYCESCRKHFYKDSCTENIVESSEFVPDNEDDNCSWWPSGTTYIYKTLYRICPECGRDDLYDKLLETKVAK